MEEEPWGIPRWDGRDRALAIGLGSVSVIAALYYFFVGTAGLFADLPQVTLQTDYYQRLATGFRAGHLHLPDAPHPRLLAQADPFAPENYPLWLWDASLFGRHYYLYFGPVPALGIALHQALSGTNQVVTDQWPTLAFLVGRLVAGAGILWLWARRLRPAPPSWLLVLTLAVFGLVHPIPFVAMRPHIWEAALTGGQCFLFVGLFFATLGVLGQRPARSWLLPASLAWGLAFGCRMTTLLAILVFVLATAVYLWWSGREAGTRARALDLVCLGAPLAACMLAYGAYNRARFGSPFDFGVAHQTTLQPFHGHSRYVLANSFSYVWTPFELGCRFPFVSLAESRTIPDWIEQPPGYATFERVGGLALLAPWLWLLPLGLVGWCAWAVFGIWRRVRSAGPGRTTSAFPRGWGLFPEEEWIFVCAVGLVLPVLPSLWMWLAGSRYPADAVGGLVLLAALAALFVWRRANLAAARVAIAGFVGAVAASTIVFGALASFSLSTRPFQRANPELFARLESAVSFCSTEAGAP